MSVLVRRNGCILLYCKGADSTVYPCLHPSCQTLMDQTADHMNIFADQGLRTLCLAVREISPELFLDWKQRYHAASIVLENRDEQLDALYAELEQDMQLVGATGINDKLQDGVPHTIAQLLDAGIRFWILTGDKQETAVTVGYSCRLLSSSDTVETYVVDAETAEAVRSQLTAARDSLCSLLMTGQLMFDGTELAPWMKHVLAAASVGRALVPASAMARGCCALVISGHSLLHVLGSVEDERLFLEVACMCRAVICCRLIPLQKAMIVNCVKGNIDTVTLAIGDGANDISMIKEADVGVGLSGQEGNQAVLASDFALAQFSFLERLLLVHGRWSYIRSCKYVRYFFYKNFAFTLCQLMYAFHNGFSAQTIYDSYFIGFYNLFFSSTPCMMLALFEQDVSEEMSLNYPQLYAVGIRNTFFSYRMFILTIIEGVFSAVIIYLIPYCAMQHSVQPDGKELVDHKTFGVVVQSILTIAVTLRCGLSTWHWTLLNQMAVWGSCVLYFIFSYLLMSDVWSLDPEYQSTISVLGSTALFWLTLVITVSLAVVPVFAMNSLIAGIRPTITDRVQQTQRQIGHCPHPRPKSSRGRCVAARPPRRSAGRRCGYAFSYDEHCGRLVARSMQVFASTQSLNLLPMAPRYTASAELTARDLEANWYSASDVDLDVDTTTFPASRHIDILTE